MLNFKINKKIDEIENEETYSYPWRISTDRVIVRFFLGFPRYTLAAYFSMIESPSCIPRRKNIARILFKLDQKRSNNLFNFKYKK